METNIETYLENLRKIVESSLSALLEKIREESPLYAAINYSLLGGGKRLRPIFTIATFEANGNDISQVLPFAAAIEMVHTYSLIHDDLPIMDNSDYRRGKLTCHKVYGSDMALLAGDALLSFAFEVITSRRLTELFNEGTLRWIAHEFAEYSGIRGLVGGQVMDMVTMDSNDIDENIVLYIERRKTASLFMLAVRVGGILSQVSEEELKNLTLFGENFGISYQIRDDILDATSTKEELGKDVGQDKKNKKATFVSLYGVDKAAVLMNEYVEKAIDYLKPYGEKYQRLSDIVAFITKSI
ncbi:MAG: polyprenyl synthetase family protein [Candidatus Atribacteria bacterium]|nr:polyprenyl synthetase family protein [Candidatus Atribacteria bacterium]